MRAVVAQSLYCAASSAIDDAYVPSNLQRRLSFEFDIRAYLGTGAISDCALPLLGPDFDVGIGIVRSSLERGTCWHTSRLPKSKRNYTVPHQSTP